MADAGPSPVRASVIEADAARGVAGRGTCEKDEGYYNSPGCRCARARLGERRVARVDATL